MEPDSAMHMSFTQKAIVLEVMPDTTAPAAQDPKTAALAETPKLTRVEMILENGKQLEEGEAVADAGISPSSGATILTKDAVKSPPAVTKGLFLVPK